MISMALTAVEVRVVEVVVEVRVATVEVRAVAMAAAVTVQVIVAVVRAVAAMAEEADLGRLLGHLAPVVLVHDGVPVGRQDEELGDHPSPAALSLRAPAAQVRAPRWLLVRRFPHNSLRPGEICREPTQDL